MKQKVLYFYPEAKAFVLSDKAILKTKYQVKSQALPWFNKKRLFFNFIRQFFYLLWHIRKTDKIIVAFGGYWSYLPMYFAKKYNKESYIILHGTDTVSFPKLNYGLLRKPLLRYVIKKSYQWATKLLPVSESLIYTENNYYLKRKVSKQGFQHHFPKLKTPFQVVYNGLDTEFWKPVPQTTRVANQFLAAFTESQWELKGGNLIVALAKHYPKSIFKIAGVSQEFVDKHKESDNIFGLGFQPKESMRILYSESAFFLQLAISEGFGLALAEAMLCESIPIGSQVNIIPKIIGNSGYILTENEVNPLVILVSEAKTKSNENLGKIAREHIKTHFSLENREENLLKAID